GEGVNSTNMITQDFVDQLNYNLSSPVWRMDYDQPINNGFPILIWQQANDNNLHTASKSESNIALYPNPTHNELNIVSDNNIKSIEMFNIFGQRVYLSNVGKTDIKISVSTLPKGNYLVRIYTDNGTITRKVIVE
ncbi:MAG: T9SS type A sorting domain-containing protein, partial [Bacteroidales bacterium]|nr:T9SS type A sorting domain-containing protein [Bacteroidales bacterium]